MQVLKEVSISDPRVPVYSNATAKPVTRAGEVAGLLARQLVEPVRWGDTLRDLVATGKTEMVRGRCPDRSSTGLRFSALQDSLHRSSYASEPLCLSRTML